MTLERSREVRRELPQDPVEDDDGTGCGLFLLALLIVLAGWALKDCDLNEQRAHLINACRHALEQAKPIPDMCTSAVKP